MSESEPQFLDVGPGEVVPARRIAYRADHAPADGIGLFWLPGYKSDMASTKATELAAFARAKGYGCTRFDYSGHGVSSGDFEDGTIGAWLEEAEAVFRRLTEGKQIIVGSSMGGYIALLLLRRLMTMAPGGGCAHRRARAHRARLGHDRRADVEAVQPQGAPRA